YGNRTSDGKRVRRRWWGGKTAGLGRWGLLDPRPRCIRRLQSSGARTQLHPPTLGGMALKIGKRRTSGKSRAGCDTHFEPTTRKRRYGFNTGSSTIPISKIVGISLIIRYNL